MFNHYIKIVEWSCWRREAEEKWVIWTKVSWREKEKTENWDPLKVGIEDLKLGELATVAIYQGMQRKQLAREKMNLILSTLVAARLNAHRQLNVANRKWVQIGTQTESAIKNLRNLRVEIKTMDMSMVEECVNINGRLESALAEAERLSSFKIE